MEIVSRTQAFQEKNG